MILVPLMLLLYVASAPFAYFIAYECMKTDSKVLWLVSDVLRFFYYPVSVARLWCGPLGDFIIWEYGKIKRIFYPN